MLIWASSFTVTKIGVQDLPPNTFAFLRFIVSSCILSLFFLLRRQSVPKISSKTWLTILSLALSGVTFYYILFNRSLMHTSASVGALIQGFIPVVVAVLAALFLKETLSLKQIAGFFLSLTGVIFIGFLNSLDGGSTNTLFGNILMIGAIICWAVYTILSKKLSELNVLFLTTAITVIGTILFIPAVIFELSGKPLPHVSITIWVSYFILVRYLQHWRTSGTTALKHLSAVQVGAFLNLDPVIGAVMAIIFLKESVSVYQVLGIILVLTGGFISTKQQKV